ncbi:MAG: hypothetical protein IJ449_04420 [Clostridia bacterium]|nr:hypothetical protein [Clostridia bacterium]
MKKTLSLLVAVVLVLGMMSMGVSAARDLTYTAQFATPVIDGQVDECWSTVSDDWTQIDLPYQNGAESVCSARAKILHDDTLVYFLVEVTDATVYEGNDDCFEIYFDEDSCKDAAYCDVSTQLRMCLDEKIIKGNNSIGDVDMVQEYKVATSENGYVLEFSVALMNGIPAVGSTIGLEFMYNDNGETNADFLNALRWNVDTANGDSAPWQSVEYFGTLTFAEYVAPAVDEAPADEAPADVADTPVTADAGIVVAAVVMAAAAGVVLSKKH